MSERYRGSIADISRSPGEGFTRACSLCCVNGLRRNGGYVNHDLLFVNGHLHNQYDSSFNLKILPGYMAYLAACIAAARLTCIIVPPMADLRCDAPRMYM
jgi:hypothetical protein